MSTLDTPNSPAERRQVAFLWWSVLASLGLMFVAGGLLWWRFGALIFVDLLSTLQACF